MTLQQMTTNLSTALQFVTVMWSLDKTSTQFLTFLKSDKWHWDSTQPHRQGLFEQSDICYMYMYRYADHKDAKYW